MKVELEDACEDRFILRDGGEQPIVCLSIDEALFQIACAFGYVPAWNPDGRVIEILGREE